MHPLNEHLGNPLNRQRDALDRERLVQRFPALLECTGPHFLGLRRYLDQRPERFYNREAYSTFLEWFSAQDKRDRGGLRSYLSAHGEEIDQALLFLREINSEAWHDTWLTAGDGYDLVRIIDRHVHPSYLRLVEAVFTPLLRPIAYFSRLDRTKGTDGLNVWSVVQEVDHPPTNVLIQSYKHTVRNGIAHGGITYLQGDIRYRDSNGNEDTLAMRSVVRLFDDLLDTCNGLSAALKVFFAVFRDGGYPPPRELLIEELQEETRTPWWKIEGCVEAQAAGMSQLTLFARPDSRDYSKVQWSAIQSGILTEYFAPGYDRYFLSLHSPRAWGGWAAFDGKRLCSLREAGADDLTQYVRVLENGLIFYVPKLAMPRLLGKLDTLVTSLRLNLSTVMEDLRSRGGIPRIVARNAAAHRNSWGAVIRGEVVIEDVKDGQTVAAIRDNRRRIIRAVMARARRGTGGFLVARLPIAFAQVAVFRRDYRRRRLASFGLSEDLVCTVRFQRLRRIQSPDLFGSTVEKHGRWRIAWNREWLEDSSETLE